MKNSPATPRSLAIDILCQWQETGKSVDQIKNQFTDSLPDQRDNQLAAALVFGVLRQRGHLDWILENFSSHPLHKMKPLTLQALRVGIYQLLYMDRIPASAAINETVQVIKKRRQPKWLSGFVNGLLRNVSRQIESSSLKTDLPRHAKLSHPQWLIDRWQTRLGKQITEEICLSNNTPAQLCLWVNSALTTRPKIQESFHQAGINTEPGLLSPEALLLTDYRGSITTLPGFAQGLFQVQDEIAQLVVYLLTPFPPGNYLDGCAGLGGKTSILAQKLTKESSITAVEPQPGRSRLLAENLTRLGFSQQVKTFAGDIATFSQQTDKLFTGVLVDTPCSGTGVIGRHPDIRWNRSQGDFIEFQKKQLNILATAAKLTAADGILVYATCSMEPEENEDVISLFLQDQTDFKIENAENFVPEPARKLIDPNGFLKTVPGKSCSDGFFAARLRKI